MNGFQSIKIEPPRVEGEVVSEFILQQQMIRKVANLRPDPSKYKKPKKLVEEGAAKVVDMSVERLRKLEKLTNTDDIIKFILGSRNPCKKCDTLQSS